jgi:hypothetical protein
MDEKKLSTLNLESQILSLMVEMINDMNMNCVTIVVDVHLFEEEMK